MTAPIPTVFRTNAELNAQARAVAKVRGQSLSDLLRTALREHLANAASGNEPADANARSR